MDNYGFEGNKKAPFLLSNVIEAPDLKIETVFVLRIGKNYVEVIEDVVTIISYERIQDYEGDGKNDEVTVRVILCLIYTHIRTVRLGNCVVI